MYPQTTRHTHHNNRDPFARRIGQFNILGEDFQWRGNAVVDNAAQPRFQRFHLFRRNARCRQCFVIHTPDFTSYSLAYRVLQISLVVTGWFPIKKLEGGAAETETVSVLH